MFSGPFVEVLIWSSSRMVPSILRWILPWYSSLLLGFSYLVRFPLAFWLSCRAVFFHILLFDGVSFQYFHVFVRFFSSGRFYLDFLVQFLPSCLASYSSLGGCPRGVMVKATDCGIVVSEFVLQSRYYVHFRANTLAKGMNP